MKDEFKKVVNEKGEQVFAVMGENMIFRVFEDALGNRVIKIGEKFESLAWYERQRFNISLICDKQLELMYNRRGM